MAAVKVNVTALVFSVFVSFCSLAFPIFSDSDANMAFSILILAVLLWITEAIPLAMTALVIPVLSMLYGLLPASDAFGQFSNPVIFLFMGGFVLAGALSAHSLDKELAHKLVGLAKGNFYKSSILLMFATSLLACWISNTSASAMMIPLALGLIGLAKTSEMVNESKFLMLGIAYSANIGGVITMIATPPNAIGAGILKMSFFEWFSYGLPIFLLTFPLMVATLTFYFSPDRNLAVGKIIVASHASRYRNRLLAIFCFTAMLWMLEGIIGPLLGISQGFNAIVAIISIVLLYVFNVMKWPKILSSIRWDVLLLFGGGLTLGVVVDRSGLATLLVTEITTAGKSMHLLLFVWLIVAFSIVLTEFMSNTASAAMMVPLLYTLALQSNINPVLLVLTATVAASYGFMLPVGTPPNAMVYSSGYVPQKDMLKVGFVIDLIFSIVLTLFLYFLLIA